MKYIISIVTRLTPRHYLHHVSHFFLRIISLFMRGNKYQDPINGKTYRKLLPYGRIKSRKNASHAPIFSQTTDKRTMEKN